MNKPLRLPSRNYGPFCCKVLTEFMAHHNIETKLPLPNEKDSVHAAISKIFDILTYSMGEEKRVEILKDLDQYMMSVPAAFRPVVIT